ncbi:succinate-semialdehyde dehydrogenase [Roseivirga ehrenbergii]|uniref:Succinate-semialdehyde dehydrogenase n=2 Tax=Roseivirga ehrenbergii (strain DSM 102268 / JCM 13514 / KCTC 12282 / NCIMB 14502 / KMM 6017) TaxID=279360 RepID=A0A150XED8_ROSEK|nr:NAD-dependent succinate-semialdehyde dehydrogenase [Roseivirga ehrenbergii]KYG77095.1 succinate-semialdehyde dehydrogenase [Roseivirga ehrenbergii]
MSMQSVNPSNNQVIQLFEPHSEDYVQAAIERADLQFSTWKNELFEYRAQLFNKLADVLEERKTSLAETMTLEMGKLTTEGIAEVEKCALVCRYYADNAEKFLKDEILKSDHSKAFISYQPLGTILAVMPWNFPLWQVFRFAAPTLMAGNVGLLKHASSVQMCAQAIEDTFIEAGFPVGAFQNLRIGSNKVEAIINDDRIKAVTLTGSEGAGSAVASVAGSKIKKSVLELGGSDPFIVLDNADMDLTVRTAVKARMRNCGQSCIAAKRFIVVERVYDEFVEKFSSFLQALKIGDPSDILTSCGPMASDDLANELLKQVNESVEKGAKVVLGGKRPDRVGAYFEPTILADLKPGMPAYEEELFGPVASLFKVKNEEEAIALANNSKFGLGASIWTQDLVRGEMIARKIESGAVFVNHMVSSDPRLPFGGIKTSGYGRELSHLGIREFMNTKTIVIN